MYGHALNDSDTSTNHHLLTANHCIDSQEEAQSVVVYWNYNTGDTPPGGTPTTIGANRLVTGVFADFTLLRLTGSLPGGLFFSGWDANPVSSGTSVTGMHHPPGFSQTILLWRDQLRLPPITTRTLQQFHRGYLEPGHNRRRFVRLGTLDWHTGHGKAGGNLNRRRGGLWQPFGK